MILFWDKPKPIMSKEERMDISADSAPPGVYVSNMSDEDRRKWKAKLVGHKSGHPQVEIRKDSTVIIVSLHGGYRYKYYGPDKVGTGDTNGINLHIASAGPMQLTFEEFEEMKLAVEEAKEALRKTEVHPHDS